MEQIKQLFAAHCVNRATHALALNMIAESRKYLDSRGPVPVRHPEEQAWQDKTNDDLWKAEGWQFRLNVGDSLGIKLREAMVASFGQKETDSLNDSVFLYLGYALVGDIKGVCRMAPRVAKLYPSTRASPANLAA